MLQVLLNVVSNMSSMFSRLQVTSCIKSRPQAAELAVLQVFPNVEKAYRQQTLGKMMERQQWSVAATFVGEDSELQVQPDLSLHFFAEDEVQAGCAIAAMCQDFHTFAFQARP